MHRDALKQLNIGLVTGHKGNHPMTFDIFPGSVADITALRKFVEDLRNHVPRYVLIWTKGSRTWRNRSQENLSG